MRKNTTNRENTAKNIDAKLNTILVMLEGMDKRVSALESARTESAKTEPTQAKAAPKKTSAKSEKTTTKSASTKKTSAKKTAPTTEAPKTEKSIKGMKLADFEPKKYDGFYRWGMKSDGFNQKSYMGMRKAYCVYKATNGEYLDAKKAYDAGVRIDYSENGAYYKAKAEFEKKFKYVKKSER